MRTNHAGTVTGHLPLGVYCERQKPLVGTWLLPTLVQRLHLVTAIDITPAMLQQQRHDMHLADLADLADLTDRGTCTACSSALFGFVSHDGWKRVGTNIGE